MELQRPDLNHHEYQDPERRVSRICSRNTSIYGLTGVNKESRKHEQRRKGWFVRMQQMMSSGESIQWVFKGLGYLDGHSF